MEIPRVDSIGASTAVNTPSPSSEKDVPVREVVAAVHEVNRSELMGEGRQLTFSRDPETRRPVIQIIDQSTGEVIDQIPSETVLQLAQQLK
jgi:flagellar protein FlaG